LIRIAFYLAAAAMILLALLLIVAPLIRGGLRQKQPHGLFAIVLAIVVLLPGTAIYLYTCLGTPAALDVSPTAHALALRVDPKQRDIQNWMEAAHAYDAEHRPEDARAAYRQVLKSDANNTAAMVGWVEADMTTHTDYSIDASSRKLLEQAIALEPDNQRALWLLGISKFQRQDYAEASATWRHLQQLLDSSSPLAPSVAQQIEIADEKAKLKGPVATPSHS
jgi:cytochrome c-type biogenesis protein CcmH